MKTLLVKVLFLFVYVAILTSCKKNKEEDVPVSEATIAGTYTLSSYTETSLLSGEKDVMAEMNECQRDDEYVLNEDKSYQYNDLGTVCALDGTHPGVWLLVGENLSFDLFIGKIERLTNRQLIIVQDILLVGSKRAVFSRQ